MSRAALALTTATLALIAPLTSAAGESETHEPTYAFMGQDETDDVRVRQMTANPLTARQRDGLAEGDILDWTIVLDRTEPEPHLSIDLVVERAIHRGKFPRWWRQNFGIQIIDRTKMEGTDGDQAVSMQRVTVEAGPTGNIDRPEDAKVRIFDGNRIHSYCRAAAVTFDRATDHLSVDVPLRCITRTGIEQGRLRGFLTTIYDGLEDYIGTGSDRTAATEKLPLTVWTEPVE